MEQQQWSVLQGPFMKLALLLSSNSNVCLYPVSDITKKEDRPSLKVKSAAKHNFNGKLTIYIVMSGFVRRPPPLPVVLDGKYRFDNI